MDDFAIYSIGVDSMFTELCAWGVIFDKVFFKRKEKGNSANVWLVRSWTFGVTLPFVCVK